MNQSKKLRGKFIKNEIKKEHNKSVSNKDWTPASRMEYLELLKRVEILEKALTKK